EKTVGRSEGAEKGLDGEDECFTTEEKKSGAGGAAGDTADSEPHTALVYDRCAGDDGKIAGPARKFAERVAVSGSPTRHLDRLDQLVVVARSRHQAGEECVCRHAALLVLRGQFDVALECEQAERYFRARIGVRNRTADCAAAPSLPGTVP